MESIASLLTRTKRIRPAGNSLWQTLRRASTINSRPTEILSATMHSKTHKTLTVSKASWTQWHPINKTWFSPEATWFREKPAFSRSSKRPQTKSLHSRQISRVRVSCKTTLHRASSECLEWAHRRATSFSPRFRVQLATSHLWARRRVDRPRRVSQ